MLYIFKDFECQPVCRPIPKALKGACDYMYPVGYIIYYIPENQFCQDFCQLLPYNSVITT